MSPIFLRNYYDFKSKIHYHSLPARLLAGHQSRRQVGVTAEHAFHHTACCRQCTIVWRKALSKSPLLDALGSIGFHACYQGSLIPFLVILGRGQFDCNYHIKQTFTASAREIVYIKV